MLGLNLNHVSERDPGIEDGRQWWTIVSANFRQPDLHTQLIIWTQTPWKLNNFDILTNRIGQLWYLVKKSSIYRYLLFYHPGEETFHWFIWQLSMYGIGMGSYTSLCGKHQSEGIDRFVMIMRRLVDRQQSQHILHEGRHLLLATIFNVKTKEIYATYWGHWLIVGFNISVCYWDIPCSCRATIMSYSVRFVTKSDLFKHGT